MSDTKRKRAQYPKKSIAVPEGMALITDHQLAAYMQSVNRELIINKLITRRQLSILAGVCSSKITTVTRLALAKFPKFICHTERYTCSYSMLEALDWLNAHDIKAMKFTNEDYVNSGKAAAMSTFDNAMARSFLAKFTVTPVFKGKGKTEKVHLLERNDHISPHPGLMLRPGGDAVHQIRAPVNWD